MPAGRWDPGDLGPSAWTETSPRSLQSCHRPPQTRGRSRGSTTKFQVAAQAPVPLGLLVVCVVSWPFRDTCAEQGVLTKTTAGVVFVPDGSFLTILHFSS